MDTKPIDRDRIESHAENSAHLSPIQRRYFDIEWKYGRGHRLYDIDDRPYLDFACGIGATALGHQHPAVMKAIRGQLDRLVHIANPLGHVESVRQLAASLADSLPEPLDTVFFSNSGGEAIDAALKLARRVTQRPGFIAFSGGFHGRTFAATSISSSNLNFRAGYEPLMQSVYISTYPNVYRMFHGDQEAATERAMTDLGSLLSNQIPPDSVAAILVEVIQGEGGFNPAPDEFLRRLRNLCDDHGILLVADEVQSGFGRTGKMWAFEHSGIVPDIVCVAKAIANGLPLGAMVSSRDLQIRWGKGAHGSTFGGNPVACAAGVAVLETIRREDLVENAVARGAQLFDGLSRIKSGNDRLVDVRGRGLMLGVELAKSGADGGLAESVVKTCAANGLLLLTCGQGREVVRWLPPLDVTSDEIDEALGAFERAAASVM